MTVKLRQAIERQIVTKIVDDALKAGHALGIDIGDGVECVSVDRENLLKEVFAGDEARIYLFPADTTKETHNDVGHEGWVFCVYGNDGTDVISDYTGNIEPLLKPAIDLAKAIDEGRISMAVQA